jgi:hypothetical protein
MSSKFFDMKCEDMPLHVVVVRDWGNFINMATERIMFCLQQKLKNNIIG